MFGEIFSFINIQNPANWLQPGLCHYLIFALFIFITGLIITITSGNLIRIIIGIEFMINAVSLNFVAINAFVNENNSYINSLTASNSTIIQNFAPVENLFFNFSIPEGQTLALFTTVIGAINMAAGLGLILAVYFKFKNINTNGLNNLKSADCPDYYDLNTEDDI